MTIKQVYDEPHIEGRWVEGDTVCDSCGERRRPRGGRWGYDGGWGESEIEIEAKIGDVYPEGDFREGYRLDLCPRCFLTKLMPLIERELGAKFTQFDPEDYAATYYQRERK